MPSSEAPDSGAPAVAQPDDSDDDHRKADRWWRGSSFELRHGLEVREVDTVPAEVFDELFSASSWERKRKP